MAADGLERGQHGLWWGDPIGELGWPLELARLLRSPVYQGTGVPAGDGAPVLVLPGFASSDVSAAVLRGWLGRIGYAAFASGTLFNVDCSDRVFRRLERRLIEVQRQTERRVALVGHSRGGQLARALAARNPDRVANVVALGSGLSDPFSISVPLAAVVSVVRRYHREVTDRQCKRGCLTSDCSCPYGESFRTPLPQGFPVTSIRASRDGVVAQEACVVPGARNVVVNTTHVGLAFNADAYRAIAVALARPAARQART